MAGETKKYSGEPLKLEMPMRILKALHSATAPGDMTSAELEKQRRSQELLGQLAAPMAGLSWEEFSLSGMKAAWMRLERPHRHARCVLYCHGGGYTSGNLGYSRVLASKLVRSTGLDTLSFEYRLAPEHPYPDALEDAFRAWDHLMYLGYGAKDVVLAGDSAGGNMALVLCLALRRAGRMLPGALLLMSPWTDMTASGASYSERAEADPILTNEYIQAVREAYAPGADYSRPEFSPLFGDFSAFPPALIQVGTHEILYSDSERLAERMKAAGCYCRLEVWENMWHVFQMAPAKKSAAAMESMAHFLLEVL
mgnify:FL=1